MTHRVSIIIPTFRRWNFLIEAIESVFHQTYRDWEIIIVNDGGGSPEGKIINFLNEPKIRYIEHQDNMGIASARNTGISKSSGEFIAYLDDDDIFYPNHLEMLISEMLKNNLVFAYTDSYKGSYVGSNGNYKLIKKEVRYSRNFDRKNLWKANFIPTLCVCHHRDCLSLPGGFDPSLKVLEDWNMWLKMSLHYTFHHIPRITAEYRVRLDQTNTTQRTSDDIWKKATVQIYHNSLNDPNITQNSTHEKYLKKGIAKFIRKNDRWISRELRGDDLKSSLEEMFSTLSFHEWMTMLFLHPLSFIRLRVMLNRNSII